MSHLLIDKTRHTGKQFQVIVTASHRHVVLRQSPNHADGRLVMKVGQCLRIIAADISSALALPASISAVEESHAHHLARIIDNHTGPPKVLDVQYR